MTEDKDPLDYTRDMIRAVEEQRRRDAVLARDNVGTAIVGLVLLGVLALLSGVLGPAWRIRP